MNPSDFEPHTGTLLHGAPHQWGPGAIHLFDQEKGRTLCGKSREDCPGRLAPGLLEDATCKVCIRSLQTSIKREQQAAEWERQRREAQAQREEESRQWWEAYERYLITPTWLEKRRLVMQRAGGLCEGCRKARAIEVHHLRYPSGVLPGSAEWIRAEKLFDLVALCADCHKDLHSNP